MEKRTSASTAAARSSLDQLEGVEAVPLDQLSEDGYQAKKKMILAIVRHAGSVTLAVFQNQMRKVIVVFIFICFLLTYNLIALSEATYGYTALKRHLTSKLEHPAPTTDSDTGATIEAPALEDVQSIEAFWQYISHVTLDALFVEDAIPTTIYTAIAGGQQASAPPSLPVTPSGLWHNKVQLSLINVRHIDPLALKQPEELMLLIAEFMLALFVLYYIAEEISELSILKLRYLRDGWNLLDWTNLILLMVAFYLRLVAMVDASRLDLQQASTDMTQYVNLLPVASTVHLTQRIHAFNIILAWLKAIKFLGFLPYSLLGFAIAKFSASIGYNVAYGESMPQLAPFGDALFFLARGFIGGVFTSAITGRLQFRLVIVLWFFGLRCLYATIAYFVSSARSTELSSDDGHESLTDIVSAKVVVLKNAIVKSIDWEAFMQTKLRGLYARWYVPKIKRLHQLENKAESRKKKLVRQRTELHIPVHDAEGNEVPPNIVADDDEKAGDEGKAPEDIRHEKRLKMLLSAKPGVRWKATALTNSITARPRQLDARSKGDESEGSSSDDGLIQLGPLQPSKIKKRRKQFLQKYRLYGHDEESVHMPVTAGEVFQSAEAMTDQLLGRTKGVGREARKDIKRAEEGLIFLRDAVQLLNRRIKDLAIQQEEVLAIQ
ncbi:TRP-like ion channel Pkd2 [Perkinsus chesapeaki]|uniref:TRP-like ion channel Pkd2 n=1 Tax=Perkinsus chesapeaki TaxID=330153 RepID=A0A7J6MW83_PERCH|nr:TRP-like ion channel Pkd2 [Perkinsus chesapeaki]